MTDIDAPTPSNVSRMIRIGVCAILYLIGLFAMIVGQQGAFDHLEGWVEPALSLSSALLVIVITFLWLNALNLTTKADEPVAPSTKKAQRTLILSLVFGAVLAGLFFAATLSDGFDITDTHLFSNSPIPPILGIGCAILYIGGMIYSCQQWYKSADEHERAAVSTALYASFYFYSLVGPAWWMLQRSGLVPVQDPMIMYILVLTVFAAIWTYKRGE